MQSIRVNLFSENPNPPIFISVPILHQEDLIQRVGNFATKYQCNARSLKEKNYVNCRDLFQEKDSPDLFFFPSSIGRCVSLKMMCFGEIFFLRHHSYGFIFCFIPNAKTKCINHITAASFREEQGYPAGVAGAAYFFFSINHISILVSEHGHMTANGNGEWTLRGIEFALLQKKRAHGKSVFVQRKNENVSPNRFLSEKFGPVNPFQMNKKYITIRCICKAPGFCYSARFPVLSAEELKEEITRDNEDRLQKYGTRSHLYLSSPLEHCLLQAPDNKHLVMFPSGMGIDVPFGGVQGGLLFFSYVDTALHGFSSEKFKLTFFPLLFDPDERIQINVPKNVKDIYGKEKNTAVSFCGSTKATVFTSSRIKLVSCSSSEYKLDGMKVEIISTKNHGGWSICFSCETINLARNPLPGPSGLGDREATDSLSQEETTVAVSTNRQGQQIQQKSRSPLPGPSGIKYQVIRPTPSRHQPASTAFISTRRQNQQTPHTQQRDIKNPVLGSFDVRHHPYPQHGTWPFSERSYPYFYPETGSFVKNFYSYRSPYPPYPYPSARQDQWMPGFSSFSSAVSHPVAALEPFRYEIPVQEEGIGHSGREEASASVPVGAVQQTSIWRPYEEPSNTAVSLQAQAENSNEDTDIDVEN